MLTIVTNSSERALTREQASMVRKHLQAVLSSGAFAKSKRAQEFLTLVVRHAVSGHFSRLRERMIGAELFGRPVDYDTGSDSVVRVMATEVRKRLAQFYLESGTGWPVRFELPSGSYEPHFLFTTVVPEIDSPPTPEQTDHAQEEAVPLESATQPIFEEAKTGSEVVDAKRFWTTGRILSLAAGFTLLFLSVGLVFYLRSRESSGPPLPIRSIVILPLKNLSGDPKQEFLADGMTEELINDLGKVSTLRVISLTSSMSFKGTRQLAPEIAKQLHVEGIIEGSIQREGDKLRIDIRLIDGRTDRPLWAQTYVRDMGNLLSVQGEVAADISHQIRTSVTPQEQDRLTRNRPIKPTAQDLYMHGIVLLRAEDDQGALAYLKQAVFLDPDSAQIHAALAECAGRMGTSGLMPSQQAFATQKMEAARAIALDPLLAEPHAELAEAVQGLDWDWQSAAREFQRALELNPNSAEIREKYAIHLLFRGAFSEAIDQVELGASLDPISAITLRNQAFVYFFARNYDKTFALINSAHSLGLQPPGWNFFLGAAYSARGEYATSIDSFLRAPDTTHTRGHLGHTYARAGDKTNAYMILTKLQQGLTRENVGQYEIALVYAGLGDHRNAIAWLQRAYSTHDVGLLYMKIDPCLDSLRAEPAFRELERNVGLTP